jgi:hypothetical protein
MAETSYVSCKKLFSLRYSKLFSASSFCGQQFTAFCGGKDKVEWSATSSVIVISDRNEENRGLFTTVEAPSICYM